MIFGVGVAYAHECGVVASLYSHKEARIRPHLIFLYYIHCVVVFSYILGSYG